MHLCIFSQISEIYCVVGSKHWNRRYLQQTWQNDFFYGEALRFFRSWKKLRVDNQVKLKMCNSFSFVTRCLICICLSSSCRNFCLFMVEEVWTFYNGKTIKLQCTKTYKSFIQTLTQVKVVYRVSLSKNSAQSLKGKITYITKCPFQSVINTWL